MESAQETIFDILTDRIICFQNIADRLNTPEKIIYDCIDNWSNEHIYTDDWENLIDCYFDISGDIEWFIIDLNKSLSQFHNSEWGNVINIVEAHWAEYKDIIRNILFDKFPKMAYLKKIDQDFAIIELIDNQLKNSIQSTIEFNGIFFIPTTDTKQNPPQLPPELSTDQARKYFDLAVEKGYMTIGNGKYTWKETPAKFGYFASRVFEKPRPIAELERYFGLSKLASAITQAEYPPKRGDKIAWINKMNDDFSFNTYNP